MMDRPRPVGLSAVSRAGACGIIETSSGELDAVEDEIRKMRDLTDRPLASTSAGRLSYTMRQSPSS